MKLPKRKENEEWYDFLDRVVTNKMIDESNIYGFIYTGNIGDCPKIYPLENGKGYIYYIVGTDGKTFERV